MYVPILGELNLSDIDWDILNGESQHSSNFCGLICDLNLCQLINSSTHKAGNILDLVLTNNDQLVCDIKVHPCSPLVYCLITLSSFSVLALQHLQERSPHGSFFNYSKANWEEMNLYFNHYNFNKLIEISDIEGVWACFKHIISTAVSQYVPKICPRRYPWPKLFNSDIQHHLHKVHTLRCQYRNKPSPNL